VKPHKLPDPIKTFITQALACGDTPTAVQRAVNAEFGLAVSLQCVEQYDPTKTAGARLGAKYRAIFWATRAAYVKEIESIGIVHRSFRLRALQRLVDRAEDAGNLRLMMRLLEQAARECG
jgi:hypothetical protein